MNERTCSHRFRQTGEDEVSCRVCGIEPWQLDGATSRTGRLAEYAHRAGLTAAEVEHYDRHHRWPWDEPDTFEAALWRTTAPVRPDTLTGKAGR